MPRFPTSAPERYHKWHGICKSTYCCGVFFSPSWYKKPKQTISESPLLWFVLWIATCSSAEWMENTVHSIRSEFCCPGISNAFIQAEIRAQSATVHINSGKRRLAGKAGKGRKKTRICGQSLSPDQMEPARAKLALRHAAACPVLVTKGKESFQIRLQGAPQHNSWAASFLSWKITQDRLP